MKNSGFVRRGVMPQLVRAGMVMLSVWIAVALMEEVSHVLRAERASVEIGSSASMRAEGALARRHLLRSDVFLLVQVSDLHLSTFSAVRTGEFCRFVRHVTGTLRPDFTVVSGDVTDAKDATQIRSQVYPEEWQAYCDCLKAVSLPGGRWMDLHGNHDRFAVPHLHHGTPGVWDCSTAAAEALAQSHGDVRAVQRLHWQRRLSYGNATAAIVALDLAPPVGLPRPVNFFGVVDGASLDWLEQTLETQRDADVRIVVGHYPLGTVTDTARSSQGRTLRAILQHHDVKAYLCGHYHDLVGLVDQMYAFHGSDPGEGLLELELADFKDHRRYRLLALSEGQLSFSDVPFQASEVVALPLRPLDARFLRKDDPSQAVHLRSGVLRAMAFSPHPIRRVSLQLSPNPWTPPSSYGYEEEEMTSSSLSLHYELAKSDEGMYEYIVEGGLPKRFRRGVHRALLRVEDEAGGVAELEYPFSVSGESVPLWSRAAIILTYPVGPFLWALCLFSMAGCAAWLLWPLLDRGSRGWMHDFCVYEPLAHRLVTLQCLGLPILPWFVGPVFGLRTSMWSAFFVFGLMHVDTDEGTLDVMQTWDTYFWALRYMACVWMPTVLLLILQTRVPLITVPQPPLRRAVRAALSVWLPALIIVLSNVLHVYYLALCYGPVAAVLSPCVSWYSAINLVLLARSLFARSSCDPNVLLLVHSDSDQ